MLDEETIRINCWTVGRAPETQWLEKDQKPEAQSSKPDSQCVDVLHGEGRVLPQLLVLLLGLAPGQDSVHRHRHQLDLDLLVRGCVVLRDKQLTMEPGSGWRLTRRRKDASHSRCKPGASAWSPCCFSRPLPATARLPGRVEGRHPRRLAPSPGSLSLPWKCRHWQRRWWRRPGWRVRRVGRIKCSEWRRWRWTCHLERSREGTRHDFNTISILYVFFITSLQVVMVSMSLVAESTRYSALLPLPLYLFL